MEISEIVFCLFFGILAIFSGIVESIYLKRSKNNDDSFEKYQSYRKSLNYNFLKIYWFIASMIFLVLYIIGEILKS